MANAKIIYLPLGGAGEIGMNLYLYGYGPEGRERFIMIDIGVTFPAMDGTPGVDLIMANIDWIAERADRLEAIFITHAHEDHIGALGLLYPRLSNVPIYVRKFTGHVARAKLEDRGLDPNRVVVVPPYPEMTSAGPFSVGIFPVPHSIPEASGLVIEAGGLRVFHTGDLKLDPDPIVGEAFDKSSFEALAASGIDALICDSTNVFSPKAGRSENTLRKPIADLVASAEGMVVATTFASNIARLKTLAQAGVDTGRSVCVLGRAMQRMLGYGHASGVLKDFPPTISLEDIDDIPRENLMLLVTGSQGEGRAASAQLARGKYNGITLREGDMFLFSSKTIPGNEVSVGRIINALAEQGVDVVDDHSDAYHVSGHANRPDILEVHNLINPTSVIPMHGEYRHLKEHTELAAEHGRKSVIAQNGTVVAITKEGVAVETYVEPGRTYLDGTRLIGAYDGVVLERIRMATRGMVSVSLVFEDAELLSVWAEPVGLPETDERGAGLAEELEEQIENALQTAPPAELKSDEAVEERVSRVVKKTCNEEVGKKPVTRILINRLEE